MKPRVVLLIVLAAFIASAQDRIRVACVGDGITFGSGVAGGESNNYST